MSEAAPRVALAEQAYSQLKAELHDFLWLPGERASELEIAHRLGMSRTPVREALFACATRASWTSRPRPAGR
jgi:DNA-binding GntR family transcriptional regulator